MITQGEESTGAGSSAPPGTMVSATCADVTASACQSQVQRPTEIVCGGPFLSRWVLTMTQEW